MKKIGSFNLGLAFAGCFLGAGYVSGQELWQFFGSFGAKGVAGLLVAVALLFFTGIIMILLGRLTRLSEIDKIVVRRDWPLLRGAVTVLELLFLFGGHDNVGRRRRAARAAVRSCAVYRLGGVRGACRGRVACRIFGHGLGVFGDPCRCCRS